MTNKSILLVGPIPSYHVSSFSLYRLTGVTGYLTGSGGSTVLLQCGRDLAAWCPNLLRPNLQAMQSASHEGFKEC